MKDDWQRVSRSQPCPVCGKPDWCLVKRQAGIIVAAICPRTPNSRPVGTRGAGYLHVLADSPGYERRWVFRSTTKASRPDFSDVAGRLRLQADSPKLIAIACGIPGTLPEALARLGVGWDARKQAATFPMSDTDGHIIGIRYRSMSGKKWAAPGSRNGVFLPEALRPFVPLFVPEGPTDTAAILALGFQAVGRPFCAGATDIVLELVRRLNPLRVVVVSDTDAPGRLGARVLANKLCVLAPTSIWTPPAGFKDVRQFVAANPREAREDLSYAAWRTSCPSKM